MFAGLGVESLDELHGLLQLCLFQPGSAPQLAVVPVCHQGQVFGHQIPGGCHHRGLVGQLTQLNQQAVLQIDGRHARGVELLQSVQNRRHLVGLDAVIRQGCLQFLGRDFQKPLAVDRIDNGFADAAIGVGQGGEIELPAKVILQAVADRGEAVEIPAFGPGWLGGAG